MSETARSFATTTIQDLYDVRDAADVTLSEAIALVALTYEPMDMTQLGAMTRLSRAAITTLVDRLDRKGLATRKAHPTDRRRNEVVLTEHGFQRTMEGIRGPIEDL